MTILWIVAIVVAFFIGLRVGMWALVYRLRTELKDPKSEAHKIFSGLFDKIDKEETESFAKGAEMYQDNSRCMNNCGREIARMFRESFKGV